jgi:hypothetical protein
VKSIGAAREKVAIREGIRYHPRHRFAPDATVDWY